MYFWTLSHRWGTLFREMLVQGAITTMTKGIGTELATKNIRCNVIAPGPVWTPLVVSSFPTSDVSSLSPLDPLPISKQAPISHLLFVRSPFHRGSYQVQATRTCTLLPTIVFTFDHCFSRAMNIFTACFEQGLHKKHFCDVVY